ATRFKSLFYASRYPKTAAHFWATCIRAPRVQQDALRTLYHFESAHNPFRKSIPIFGVMRCISAKPKNLRD
ncbi:hypothetical protein AB9F47_33585, partial [Rhizobium leguminosarum]|uniref:hypothetical protein n=1 Tax=Rhizobium leguminosarum TaxID=384 RepID=UPI003F944D92